MFRFRSDAVLFWTLRACGIVTGAIVVLILGFLVVESMPAICSIGFSRLMTDPSWHPSSDATQGKFNVLPMIVATLLTTTGACLLAAPLGIGSAVFSHYYAPRRLGIAYGKIIELLAGIPSVVYGFWGLVVLVPLISRWQPPGTSLMAATIVLTIMILPTIALVAGASLDNLPRELFAASAALGLSRTRTVFSVALPAARAGLYTAMLLGAGRAIGETMAVLLVAGNVVQVPTGMFDPVRTITANIALEMAYATGDHRGALFICGLLLMGLVIVLVKAADSLGRSRAYA